MRPLGTGWPAGNFEAVRDGCGKGRPDPGSSMRSLPRQGVPCRQPETAGSVDPRHPKWRRQAVWRCTMAELRRASASCGRSGNRLTRHRPARRKAERCCPDGTAGQGWPAPASGGRVDGAEVALGHHLQVQAATTPRPRRSTAAGNTLARPARRAGRPARGYVRRWWRYHTSVSGGKLRRGRTELRCGAQARVAGWNLPGGPPAWGLRPVPCH